MEAPNKMGEKFGYYKTKNAKGVEYWLYGVAPKGIKMYTKRMKEIKRPS